MSRRPVVATLAALSAIILVLAVVGRGSFLHALAMVPIVAIALFILAVGGLIALFGGDGPEVGRLATVVMAFGFAMGSLYLSVPIGWLLNRHDIELAKAYCDSLRPELERQRSRTGRYPERWPLDSARGPLPRVLRGTEFYHPYPDSYVISFGDPSGMLNGFAFDSRQGAWSEWD